MFSKYKNINERNKIFDPLEKESNRRLSFGAFEASVKKRHFKNYLQNQN